MINPGKLSAIGVMRLQAVLMALLGLVAGVIYSLGGVAYDMATTGSVNPGTALAFLSLLGMPALFGLGGAILGLAGAGVYNLFASRLGRLEIEIYQETTGRRKYNDQ